MKTRAPKREPSQEYVKYMLSGWAERDTKTKPLSNVKEFRQRRGDLSKKFPGETLIIPTGHELTRANDTTYRFRPGSDFYYLTGATDPGAVLVLIPEKKGGHRSVLFVDANTGRKDASFFSDAAKGELWVGPSLSVEESRERFGVDEARPVAELPVFLKTLQNDPHPPYRAIRGLSQEVDKALRPRNVRDGQLAQALGEQRLIKSPAEVAEIAKAIGATQHGFDAVVRSLREGESEREVEGLFNFTARVEGNDVGYETIAAGGDHATILHWTRNDGRLKDGKLLLLDAGVESETLYTADVTRTVPVSGKFTPAQRQIYELVLRAQKAALACVKPGVGFWEPHQAAMRVLEEGLKQLGIELPVPGAYRRYTLHGVSHMLGLDVHDCARARPEVYTGPLRSGMVLTVEPGLYFQPDDLTVPEAYRGIGVRIEDDVLVTEEGHEVLSKGFPSSPDAVEAWVRDVR
jgi:Xaa-Pro aminopeptidase